MCAEAANIQVLRALGHETEVPVEPTVAVIGGGPAGLVAAKSLVEAGFLATIFERQSLLRAGVCQATKTSVSRFSCCFSDFPWPPGSPEFPSLDEVSAYLASYADTFLADRSNCKLRLGCEVLRVTGVAAPTAASPALVATAGSVPGAGHAGVLRPLRFSGPWRVEWRGVGGERQPSNAGEELVNSAQDASQDRRAASVAPPAPPQWDVFDYVVVASGWGSQPREAPHIPGLDSFRGLLLHSRQYHGPEDLAGRARVAVVGGCQSSVDIAAQLAVGGLVAAAAAAAGSGGQRSGPAGSEGGTAVGAAPSSEPPVQGKAQRQGQAPWTPEVVHVFPRPFWLVPRCVPLDPAALAPAFVPLELALLRRSLRLRGGSGEEQRQGPEQHRADNAFWASLCGDQGALISPALHIPADSAEPPLAYISDTYGLLAAQGRIQVRAARLLRVEAQLPPAPTAAALVAAVAGPVALHEGAAASGGNCGGARLVLSDGGQPLEGVDAIILCADHRPGPPFLQPELLSALSRDPGDGLMPDRGVSHPEVAGMAFVGRGAGMHFAAAELQARLAAAALAGAVRCEADPAPAVAAAERKRLSAEALRTAEAGIQAALGQYARGRGVAGAVFRGLGGEWELRRSIVSRLASWPSGEVTGTASFTLAPPPAASAAASRSGGIGGSGVAEPPLQYLYREAGVFATEGGASLRISRDYVYAYDAGEDRIDAFFPSGYWGVRSADGGVRGYLFHSLRFLPPGGAEGQEGSGERGASRQGEEGGDEGPGVEWEVGSGGVSSCGSGGAHRTPRVPPPGELYGADGLVAGAAGARCGAAVQGTQRLHPVPGVLPGARPACWLAVGEHPCGRDMYYALYRFEFRGFRLRQFTIQFTVKGPDKDYVAAATYTRPHLQRARVAPCSL